MDANGVWCQICGYEKDVKNGYCSLCEALLATYVPTDDLQHIIAADYYRAQVQAFAEHNSRSRLVEMSDDKRCDSCCYYIETGGVGTCRRYPATNTIFVEKGYWCGEHKLVVRRQTNGTAIKQAEDSNIIAPAPSVKRAFGGKLPSVISMGFTGDICDTCGSTKMVRNGGCLVCTDCGTTTGCG